MRVQEAEEMVIMSMQSLWHKSLVKKPYSYHIQKQVFQTELLVKFRSDNLLLDFTLTWHLRFYFLYFYFLSLATEIILVFLSKLVCA